MAGAEPIRSQQPGAPLGVPHWCRVPRIWAVLNCCPRPQAGSWMGSRTARIRTGDHMGSWHMQGEDFRMRGKGTPAPFWWGDYLVQPLWKSVWRVLWQVETDLPYDSGIPHLGIYPYELDSEYEIVTSTIHDSNHILIICVHRNCNGYKKVVYLLYQNIYFH